MHTRIHRVESHEDWLVHLFGASEVSPGDRPSPLETFHTHCLGSRGCLHPWSSKTLLRSLLNTESHVILTMSLIFISFFSSYRIKECCTDVKGSLIREMECAYINMLVVPKVKYVWINNLSKIRSAASNKAEISRLSVPTLHVTRKSGS